MYRGARRLQPIAIAPLGPISFNRLPLGQIVLVAARGGACRKDSGAGVSLSSELAELARVYRRVALADLARLWTRRLRLNASRLLTAGTPRAGSPRVVVSLTTIPSRIVQIKAVLNSLIDQTVPAHKIVLALPDVSRREKREYTLPAFLSDSQAITVLRCVDWGPATKLIPMLLAEPAPDTLILAVDDDTIYPPDLIANLLAWHAQHPDATIGLRGWSLPDTLDWRATQTVYGTQLDHPLRCDVLTGTWGFMVQPRFFDEQLLDYAAYPHEAFFVDDVWFNGHLARRHVPRLIVPCRRPPMSTRLTRTNGLFFRNNRDGHNNNVVIRAFADAWRVDAPHPPGPRKPHAIRAADKAAMIGLGAAGRT
jgi:hypothetical protein